MTTTSLKPTDLTVQRWHRWRAGCIDRGVLPVIGVAGSRGKSTVVRMLDAIFREAGLSTALRTNLGVEIEGRRQPGELAPWADALAQLENGLLDVAIEEIDWTSVLALGLEPGSLPLAVVTNVCGNRESCLIQGESKRAVAAMPSLLAATGPRGMIVLNGEDYAVAPEGGPDHPATLFGQTLNAPAIRTHADQGGHAVWMADGIIVAGTIAQHQAIIAADTIPNSLHGKAGFQVQNALAAIAAALDCGIPADVIARGLRACAPAPAAMRDSFQTIEIDGVTVVIDRPNPSWFLRQVLRSARDASAGRIFAVVGRMAQVPEFDLTEVGRLLGRSSAMIVMHSEGEHAERSDQFRRGVALNEVPPPIVHTKSERRAVARALNQAAPGDVVVVLADLALPLAKALSRPSLAGNA